MRIDTTLHFLGWKLREEFSNRLKTCFFEFSLKCETYKTITSDHMS